MAWVVSILLLGVIVALVWASADVGSGVYLRTLCRVPRAERVVALTFDDGPDKEHTPRVLDLLKREGVTATFFVVGAKAEQNPELIRRIVAEGHTVANHSYHHLPQSTLLSSHRYAEELERCEEVVVRLTGLRMRLYRPPFGVTNPLLARAVKGLGLVTVGWSVRSLDTVSTDADRVVRRIMKRVCGGDVILLHDRLENAEEVLEKLLTALQDANFTTTTVDKLFKIDAYEK